MFENTLNHYSASDAKDLAKYCRNEKVCGNCGGKGGVKHNFKTCKETCYYKNCKGYNEKFSINYDILQDSRRKVCTRHKAKHLEKKR